MSFPNGATLHGKRRFRERVRLPARALKRQVALAWMSGLRPEELTGVLRTKLDMIRKRHAADERPAEYRVWRDYIYVLDRETRALITVYPALLAEPVP
jgi:hypothetical protein